MVFLSCQNGYLLTKMAGKYVLLTIGTDFDLFIFEYPKELAYFIPAGLIFLMH